MFSLCLFYVGSRSVSNRFPISELFPGPWSVPGVVLSRLSQCFALVVHLKGPIRGNLFPYTGFGWLDACRCLNDFGVMIVRGCVEDLCGDVWKMFGGCLEDCLEDC